MCIAIYCIYFRAVVVLCDRRRLLVRHRLMAGFTNQANTETFSRSLQEPRLSCARLGLVSLLDRSGPNSGRWASYLLRFGTQNPGTDILNSLSTNTNFPVSLSKETVTSSTGKSTPSLRRQYAGTTDHCLIFYGWSGVDEINLLLS